MFFHEARNLAWRNLLRGIPCTNEKALRHQTISITHLNIERPTRALYVDPANRGRGVHREGDLDLRSAVSGGKMRVKQVGKVQLHLVLTAAKAVHVFGDASDGTVVANADQQR